MPRGSASDTVPPSGPSAAEAEASPLFRAFRDRFGAADAQRVLDCGAHREDRPKTDDCFADCLHVAVGYRCFTEFRESHGFEAAEDDLREWTVAHADFSPYMPDKLPGDIVDSFKQTFADFGVPVLKG